MVAKANTIIATFNCMPEISSGSLMQYSNPTIEKKMDGTQIQ